VGVQQGHDPRRRDQRRNEQQRQRAVHTMSLWDLDNRVKSGRGPSTRSPSVSGGRQSSRDSAGPMTERGRQPLE
jgi:hypothetical protein